MKKALHSFLDFVREQGVVGLAIGFILGGSVKTVVSSLVEDIIQPLIGLIFGNVDGLSEMQYLSIRYGAFLSSLIDFFIIAAVVYFVFKQLKLEKLDKAKD